MTNNITKNFINDLKWSIKTGHFNSENTINTIFNIEDFSDDPELQLLNKELNQIGLYLTIKSKNKTSYFIEINKI